MKFVISILEIDIFLFIKVTTRVLDNAHKPAKDIHILVDNGMVNVFVQIVATIDMEGNMVGVTAMGEMLEVGEIVYMNIYKEKQVLMLVIKVQVSHLAPRRL